MIERIDRSLLTCASSSTNEQWLPAPRRRIWADAALESGGLLIALGLPVVINPWAALPFEPVKAALLCGIVLVMLSLMFVATRTLYDWRRQIFSKVAADDWLLWLYTLVVLVSTLISSNVQQSLWGNSDRHGALTTGCAILFCWLLKPIYRHRMAQDRLSLGLLAGSVPVCLYGFTQLVGYDPFTWTTDSVSPVLSTLGRSNYLAAYLAVIIPFTLYWLFVSKQRQSSRAITLSLSILLIQISCLLVTQARAGWLAMTGGAVVFYWVSQRTLPWWRTSLVVGCFVLCSFTLFAGFDAWHKPAADHQAHVPVRASFAEQRIASVERRSLIWQATLRLLTKRWWIGYGPETFVTVFQAHYPSGSLYDGADAIVDDPHNSLLEQAFSLGIPGLLLWCGLVLDFYRRIGQRSCCATPAQLSPAALAGAMTAYLIQAQFNPDVIMLTVLFWLLLALIPSTHHA